jgi:hypothetical protein
MARTDTSARPKGWYHTRDFNSKFCVTNLFIMLNFVLQKASTGADPHYLDVWQPAHQGNADTAEKLVSISFYSYAIFVTSVLNSILCWSDIQRS